MHAITLATAISTLQAADPRHLCPRGFRNAHAYWGDDAFLAVEPSTDVTVGEMLGILRTADGAMFPSRDTTRTRFVMMHTPVWLATRGNDGQPLTAQLLADILTE